MSIFSNQVAVGLISGVVASAVTLSTAAFGYWNKDRELDIEMVRVSLSILAGENKETSLQGRRFALRALKQYSRIDIPDDEFETWAKNGTVPPIRWTTTEDWTKPSRQPILELFDQLLRESEAAKKSP